MNGLKGNLAEALIVRDALDGELASIGADVMIAPPATLIAALSAAVGGSRLMLAGQDCHAAASGAHTGDIAPEMLKECGRRSCHPRPFGAAGGPRRDECGGQG